MNTEPVRILVVDDELGMREGCRKILTPEGYVVETAPDGVAGLEVFRQNGHFAVVLVDLKMPRMGGMELIKHLREIDDDVVIFVITAYAAIDTAVEATRRGAYGYIPKPFTPEELLLPIRNGLDRRNLAIEAKRLRAERESRLLELVRERSQSSTIISCMTDGVLVINRDSEIVLRNTAVARILPESSSVALPAPLSSLESEELRGLIVEVLESARQPVIVSRQIGLESLTYMVNASTVLGPSNDVLGAVAVLRDITELKKLETAKSMFMSMVAHEVKSPLAAVESQLTAVLGGALDDDVAQQRAMLERALLRARSLRTLVGDLLNLTAMETGKFTITRVPLGLRPVLEEVVDANREKAQEKGIEVFLDMQPEAEKALVMADRDALSLVFGNLVDNALKYTEGTGRVSVRLSVEGGFVRVEVRDSGIGMTEEEVGRIFDEFYRAKNEHTVRIPGTGLGLTLVKRLVEMHDGSIRVESRPGEGSTFTVKLPVAAG